MVLINTNHSYRMAMHRQKMSLPMRWLVSHSMTRPDLRTATVLDYGCGHGQDVRSLCKCNYMAKGWDPHWNPDESVLISDHYDFVTCHYVLNVIETEHERQEVIRNLFQYLQKRGRVFVSVRNDRTRTNGWAERGTFQCWVELPEPWELLHKESGFRLYTLDKANFV